MIEESKVIAGVYHVTPDLHRDSRGVFCETWRQEWFPSLTMVQANQSDKTAGTLVGLHFHIHQTDYWTCPRGYVQVVLHDLRDGSPTQGNTHSMLLGNHLHHGVLIPPGVAHGFLAVADSTLCYMVDRYYDPEDELGVAWDDPDVGAYWWHPKPVMSERDRKNPPLERVRGTARFSAPFPSPFCCLDRTG